MHSAVPGSELTKEPFRWDQRMFALVLRMAGTQPPVQEAQQLASDPSPIDDMCEVTGGMPSWDSLKPESPSKLRNLFAENIDANSAVRY